MKYLALVILPKSTNVTDEKSVEHDVAKLLQPYEIDGADVPVEKGNWDYYSRCTWEFLVQIEWNYPRFAGVSVEQSPIIFPIENLTSEGVTDSIITPDGGWQRSKSTYKMQDPEWADKALKICHSYPGHFAALIYCHG